MLRYKGREHVGGNYLVVGSCGCGLYRVRWGGYYGLVRRGVVFYIFLCLPILYCVFWVCPFYIVRSWVYPLYICLAWVYPFYIVCSGWSIVEIMMECGRMSIVKQDSS